MGEPLRDCAPVRLPEAVHDDAGVSEAAIAKMKLSASSASENL